MQAVFAPTAVIHSCTALATNSGPLSDLIWPGVPRRMNRSDSASITSMALSLASAMFWPCETTTSTCRKFAAISQAYNASSAFWSSYAKRHTSGRITARGEDHAFTQREAPARARSFSGATCRQFFLGAILGGRDGAMWRPSHTATMLRRR
jgi:hypothetical protein